MPTIQTVSDQYEYTVPAHQVYKSDTLRGPWELVSYLFVDRLRTVCGPDIDTATLRFDYGFMLPLDSALDQPIKVEPFDLNGKFIKIVIPQPAPADPFTWYGIVELDERDVHGNSIERPTSTNATSRGTQMFTAYGLLRLLELTSIQTAHISTSPITHLTIGRGLPFNLDDTGKGVGRGNRSAVTDTSHPPPDGVYLFAEQPSGAAEWSAWEAVRYLLKYQAPVDAQGDQLCKWTLAGTESVLNWHKITAQTDGQTVKEMLDALISRRRCAGYYVTFAEHSESPVDTENPVPQVTVHVFTFLSDSITLTDGAELAANTPGYTLDFENAVDIQSAVVKNIVTSRFDRIVTRGEFKTSTFTARFAPEVKEFVPDWKPTEEQAYLDAAKDETGYDALELVEKIRRNDIFRSSDALEAVYSRFVISPEWTQRVVDPEANAPRPEYFVAPPIGTRTIETDPPVTEEYTIELYNADTQPDGEPFWAAGCRFEPYLPLRERLDYSSTYISEARNQDYYSGATTGQIEYLRPFAFIVTEFGPPVVWQLVDRLAADGKLETGGRTWSAAVVPRGRGLGLELRVHGRAQHMLAVGFGAGTAAAYDEQEDPDLQGGLPYIRPRATVCMQLDSRVQATKVIATPAAGKQERVLFIDVADARLDYVVPGTVVALKDGKLIKSTSGGFVRDDRARLRDIAAAAAEWYGRQRQTLALSFRQLNPIVSLGQLITDVGPTYKLTGINTVVTALEFDLLSVTTSFETSYADLDLQ